MTLYELMDSVTLQGNIEVRNLLVNGDTKEALYFESQDDLRSADLQGMEDLQVTYMYSEKFEKRYWNHTATCSCMIIEVEEE